MNYTQNEKIAQVTETTLVIGIDVGSENHYARAFSFRGIEYSRKAMCFTNTRQGFNEFLTWAFELCQANQKNDIIVGAEPTGHYWFDLGKFLQDNGIKLVLVNPHAVKKSKELDDNHPTKNDRKDPKVIAGLVNEGRYSYPYLPEGIYADLRTASNLRFRLQKDIIKTMNHMSRWFSIYFPEYSTVYGKIDAVSGLMIIKQAPTPEEIVALGAAGVNQIWRDAKLRACGMKRAETLVAAAKRSIGTREGLTAARLEIRMLLEEYEYLQRQLEEVLAMIEDLVNQIPEAKKLLEIKGIGMKTVSGFLAEVGDIRRFNNPKQLQKLAGLAIVENSSGKHKGQTTISRRGRKRLRYLLFEAAMSLAAKNSEFREIHRYYTTRAVNPLKKMQSLMAIAGKLIRVFYALLTKNARYNPQKMLTDIVRPASESKTA